MTVNVDDIIEDVFRREGGFVNDPDDPGGATNHGVTIGTMQRLGIDMDGDGDVDVDDVKLLTKARAMAIYKKQYFEKPRIPMLPSPLQPSVFDMQINSGSNAIKILQQLLHKMGYDISIDGGLGPQTARITHEAYGKAPEMFVDAYGIARRNYYYALGDKRVKSRKYAKRKNGGKGGWITRAEEFIRPQFHMTAVQHKARTAKWA